MLGMIDIQLEDEQLREFCISLDSVRSDPLIELGRDLLCIYYAYNAILDARRSFKSSFMDHFNS